MNFLPTSDNWELGSQELRLYGIRQNPGCGAPTQREESTFLLGKGDTRSSNRNFFFARTSKMNPDERFELIVRQLEESIGTDDIKAILEKGENVN